MKRGKEEKTINDKIPHHNQPYKPLKNKQTNKQTAKETHNNRPKTHNEHRREAKSLFLVWAAHREGNHENEKAK